MLCPAVSHEQQQSAVMFAQVYALCWKALRAWSGVGCTAGFGGDGGWAGGAKQTVCWGAHTNGGMGWGIRSGDTLLLLLLIALCGKPATSASAPATICTPFHFPADPQSTTPVCATPQCAPQHVTQEQRE